MKYTLSILVENQPGVLSKVSGLFSRRGFNIDSLAVGETENPDISRITIVVDGDEYIVEQVEKQLNKLINVIKVKNLTELGSFLSAELAMIKINCPAKQRPEIMSIAQLTGAKVVAVCPTAVTLQLADTPENIQTFTDLLHPYGIKESVYTGTIALEKGAGTAQK